MAEHSLYRQPHFAGGAAVTRPARAAPRSLPGRPDVGDQLGWSARLSYTQKVGSSSPSSPTPNCDSAVHSCDLSIDYAARGVTLAGRPVPVPAQRERGYFIAADRREAVRCRLLKYV